MRVMTRMGQGALDVLGAEGEFVALPAHGRHAADRRRHGRAVAVQRRTKYIVHFPERREIWSYGSGYGGNALLGKKCFALRIASAMGRDEGWMAEHMLILKLTNPEGAVKYIAGAFPSACGKTNLAMLQPTLPGWKVQTIGDDIAWMKFGADGRLYAINPEAGFFGVAPGTSYDSNPSAMDSIRENAVFTNVAKTPDGDVWWEGMTDETPERLTDWRGNDWTPASEGASSHPNARFTAPAAQCPVIAPEWEDPAGVPIDAILFGGRRANVVPLVCEAFNWEHGVFLGATMASEMTAAAAGAAPGSCASTRWRCCRSAATTWATTSLTGCAWASVTGARLPRVFYVNWFRKGADGRFLWPGFGENSRVLEWVFRRCDGAAPAVETPIGLLPTPDGLDTDGLDIAAEDLHELLTVDAEQWRAQLAQLQAHFEEFGDRLPSRLADELRELGERLGRSSARKHRRPRRTGLSACSTLSTLRRRLRWGPDRSL